MRENSDRFQNRELNNTTAIAFAQEISRELALDRLLVRLLEILRQTTPTQRICLLEKQEQWSLIAANDSANEINIFPSFVLEIPMAIVDYVAQTQASLILDDAANEERFVKDPDVNARQVRSVLCVPLLESDFSGVLYLENREIAGAFRPQLSNYLQIITNQAAIAISNARQHQQLETELQASQAELAGILDIASDAVISVDSSQNICRFNQGAEKIFGYRAEEVLGQSLDLLLPGRAVETHHQHIKDFGNKSVAPSRMMGERRSVYGRRQDGTEFPAEASISKFKLGQQKIYTAILRDISDRKIVEADLQRAKEAAESANRAKSEFLANMSHELRTPLNAILGFTQLMRRDSSLKASQQEYLDIVGRSGEHLLDLINDILTMSKIEAGIVTLNENSFDLYWLLDSLEEMLRLRAESKGLQLNFEIAPEVPQYINSDEGKLRQVLINLLGNAIKFTQAGSVKLLVGVKAKPSNSKFNLQFEVADTGAGIASEELGKLFQAFAQTETGRKSQAGTGLGLSIARQFVRLLGGEIGIDSTVDIGTLVRFDIQTTLAEATEITSKRSPTKVIGLAPDQPPYRILVVEDKLASRQILVKLLESVGFAVTEAENGQQAIAEWSRQSPHLIWMDMRMPVMDGYEATKRIKATTRGQNTKILALTASAFEEEKAIVLSAGCDDFIRKPFKTEVLFEKMTEHLGVQYLYAEPNEKNNDLPSLSVVRVSDLAVMPTEWIAQLQKYSTQAKDKQIMELIEQIPPQQAYLVQSLRDLVDNFHFDKIIDLTSSYL